MNWLLKAHLLNIDTALGAVLSSNFIAKSLDLSLSWVINASLFVSVLIIYNFDHLADARKITGIAQTRRHQFYKEYGFSLQIFQVVLMLLGIILLFFLPLEIVKGGSIIVVGILFYFGVLEIVPSKSIFFKELSIAAIYTIAIFFAPMMHYSEPVSLPMILFVLEFFILALLNLIVFALYDTDADALEGHPSLVNVIGKKNTTRWLFILYGLLTISGICYYLISNQSYLYQVVILSMGSILLFLGTKIDEPNFRNSFRIIGDSVFLLPGLLLLIR